MKTDDRPVAGQTRGPALSFVVDHPLLTVLLVALFARVVTSLIAYNVFGGSPVLDDETYSRLAMDAAAGSTGHWDEFETQLYNRTATLTVPLTWLYALLGPHAIAGQLFVGIVGAFTAVICTRLAREGLPAGLALITGFIVALLPSQVLWSSLILKDGVVWFLLTGLALTIALAGRAARRKLAIMACVAIVLLLLLAYLRQHTFVIASCAVALAGWVGRREHRGLRASGGFVVGVTLPWILGLGPAGLVFASDSAQGIEKLRTLNALGASAFIDEAEPSEGPMFEEDTVARLAEESDLSPETIKKIATDSADLPTEPEGCRRQLVQRHRLSERASEVICDSRDRIAGPPLAAEEDLLEPNLRHLPVGISVMLFEPTPWRSSNSQSLRLAQLETIVWYPILLLGLTGLWGVIRSPRVGLFPLLAGGGSLLTYALTEGNIGTAYRHRGEFVWVVALAAGFGIRQLLSWRIGRSQRDSVEKDVEGGGR